MLSIPIINRMSTEQTREAYLDLLSRGDADRVFLSASHPHLDTQEEIDTELTLLKENMAFYGEAIGRRGPNQRKFQIGAWTGGLGHGGPLYQEKEQFANFTKIRGLSTGIDSDDSFCPLDPAFRSKYIGFITQLAKTGVQLILLDDDFRINWHGSNAILGCACEQHMALFNARAKDAGLADHDYTREELAVFLFNGPATPLRKIWMDLMGETLRDFARDLRKAVDAVDPNIRIGQCACLCSWDIDGTDCIEISRILAGSTKPFLRVTGAPYWNNYNSFGTTGLGSILDVLRMQVAWCHEKAPEIELMSEDDVYPRPRFNTPASFGESYHQVLIADGMPDILKYMIDYAHEPNYETGYIRLHERKRQLRTEIAGAFDGLESAGIYVYEATHKLANADCTGMSELDIFSSFIPASANYVSRLALPASFTRTKYTPTTLVFGDNANTVPAEALDAHLILDAVSAQILAQKGLDIGLLSAQPMENPKTETTCAGKYSYQMDTKGRFWHLTLAENAQVISTYDDGVPAVYSYKRSNGKTVVVYAFDMESVDFFSKYMRNYGRRWEILQAVDLEIPVRVENDPGLYVICRRNEEKMAVGMWNFGKDIILPQENIQVDDTFCTVSPISTGEVKLTGKALSYSEEIPPFCFGGFVLQK